MKIKRIKHLKQYLSFYKNNFGFREPYLILLDGTFCQAALESKIQIKEQLPKYFGGEVQLCTTTCVIHELSLLEKELGNARIIAQRFQRRHCAHKHNPVSATECLLSLVQEKNWQHYFLATQDPELTGQVKRMPCVPLLYIIQNTPVLDRPSVTSKRAAIRAQAAQLIPTQEKLHLREMKAKLCPKADRLHQRRPCKRPAGPNPLSCLKKKKKHRGVDVQTHVGDKAQRAQRATVSQAAKKKKDKKKKKKIIAGH
uniref:rRNA-processing protein UTP23 homolog n=1 Tax=Myxine glutinosa TaxID=7769 RepID=UPI0035902A5A